MITQVYLIFNAVYAISSSILDEIDLAYELTKYTGDSGRSDKKEAASTSSGETDKETSKEEMTETPAAAEETAEKET